MKKIPIQQIDEETLLTGASYNITYKVSKSKTTVIQAIIRDVFEKDGKWFIILETGLAIEIEDVVVISN